MFKFWKVSSFFGLASLKCGVKIVGFITLILYSTLFIIKARSTVNLERKLRTNIYGDTRELQFEVVAGLNDTCVYAGCFFFSLLLLFGVYKDNKKYLQIWLIIQFVLTLMNVVNMLLNIVTFYYVPVGFRVVFLIYQLYLLLVVHSHYDDLFGECDGS